MSSTDFPFTVDETHNKANNELIRDSRRLVLSAGVFGLIQLAVAAGVLWYFGGQPWVWMMAIALTVMALVSFGMMFVLPRKVGTAQELYDRYPLVPAVVAAVNERDLVLLALVDTTVDGNEESRWALAARTVTRLAGHPRKVGERVPSVAVAGQRNLSDREHWSEVTPMPIAWATPDRSVIDRASDTIPAAQWKRLEKSVSRLAEVRETPEDLLVLD
ncbi:DUF3239 domain-containing protein [Corynebacterium pygosceleis]|uniref:DUF3239 domain-containing protein n=1 Tax=Corynebacterium pygosceleis TaxID=2800406 RepID=A0A9Q4C9I5_9CORY|nr:DUF3239 domain-containing protein [Corynebacterium pygosceleis]MCK7638193.1 DUF3239 domain-containing protein [Corynebacterium pygosceleis]MCK7675906.1 DUF3239 domain-containing protein [Corynebacterium pygosceleis]MCL0120712.1 DUF3239 domain-containing protein [Corynebacterium pygosceleis]MCX7444252.1 DUF3239 domain-containing protein [Corynebacterium pygosceleis]MCX7468909.1 DUF3239 domain-containing protein [Corynebacterium pygosceleis]